MSDTENNLNENDKYKGLPANFFKKILVVDDILYVLKSISKILKSEGYFVITAMTGKDALAKYKNYSPDLVTVDQKLPDMTGSQLVKKIREIDVEQKSKIIFISAVYDKEEIKSILNLNVNNYLLKPFQKKKLIETVNSIFDRGVEDDDIDE